MTQYWPDAIFREHFSKMVKLKPKTMVKLDIGEIKSNQLVRGARRLGRVGLQGLWRFHTEFFHEFLVVHWYLYQIVSILVLLKRPVGDLRVRCAAARVDDVQAKAFNIFQESNTTVSRKCTCTFFILFLSFSCLVPWLSQSLQQEHFVLKTMQLFELWWICRHALAATPSMWFFFPFCPVCSNALPSLLCWSWALYQYHLRIAFFFGGTWFSFWNRASEFWQKCPNPCSNIRPCSILALHSASSHWVSGLWLASTIPHSCHTLRWRWGCGVATASSCVLPFCFSLAPAATIWQRYLLFDLHTFTNFLHYMTFPRKVAALFQAPSDMRHADPCSHAQTFRAEKAKKRCKIWG